MKKIFIALTVIGIVGQAIAEVRKVRTADAGEIRHGLNNLFEGDDEKD